MEGEKKKEEKWEREDLNLSQLFKIEFRAWYNFIWTGDSALRLRNAYAVLGIWTELKNNFNKIE